VTPSSPDERQTRRRERSRGLAAANLGLNFATAMAVLSYIGYRIDRRRGGGTAFTLAGIFLGLIYGGYEVWKMVRSGGHDSEESQQP